MKFLKEVGMYYNTQRYFVNNAIWILKEKIGRDNGLLLLGALLSWGAMILSPHYPDRASFGTMALLLCVILSMAGKAVDRQKENAWMYYSCAMLVWLRGMYYLAEFLGLCWGWIR